MEDKTNRIRFFEETFLVANISPKIVFGMPFLTLSDADVDFSGQELWWKTYTTEKVLPTTRRIKLVGKKEFAAAALDPEHETYVIHVASLSSAPLVASLDVYPFWMPQISGLIAEEAPTKVSAKYLDFADIFSLDLAIELHKHTEINIHAIDLEKDKQPPYRLIYSLGPVELETLKTYIKTNLANGFIYLSKSPAGTLILLNKKSDGSLCLYVNYWDLNNITIKNWYLLLLVNESFNRLSHTKQFI